MWSIQYNQSTNRFELTQDGFVILELEAKELDQIAKDKLATLEPNQFATVTTPLFGPTMKAVKIVKNREA